MKKYYSISILMFQLFVFSFMGHAQSLFLNGTDTFFISSGETVSSVGGFKFIGTGGSKFSFPRETTPSNTFPNTRRVLATNANATFEVRNVASNQLANFYVDVMISSNSASADLFIDNKNSTSRYQLKVNQLNRLGYNDILTEWTITRVNANVNDIHNLTFNWGNDLEPALISNKRLFVYDNSLSAWCQLPLAKTTIDENANTLIFNGYRGALDNTKFMIAETNTTGDLTIVSSGGHNHGSTWSHKNGYIAPLSTSPVLINASDIQSYLSSASIVVEAGSIIHNTSVSVSNKITEIARKITINQNITSSNSSDIEFNTDTLNFGSGIVVTSSGQLILAPRFSSSSIGLAGAAGTLQLPSSYFSTNIGDGFSMVQIGNTLQSGNISVNAFTIKDHMTFMTSGILALGGKPALGNKNITLGSAISSISGMPTHYFQTNGTGSVNRTLNHNSNLIFPVGNKTYNPITITNKTGIADTFSINILDTVYLNGSTSGNISNPHVKRTWNISKNTPTANAGSGVDLTFNWNANEVVGTLTNPTLNHHNGSGWEIPTMGTTNVSGNSLTYTGYKGTFSPFAIGGSNVVALPVELKSFNAECQSDYVHVNWTTASEINNKAFELYKSNDAINWKTIYTVEGQGDKATETEYSFKDMDKKPNYYRLKDLDFEGMENWSHIIFADCKSNTSKTEVYPNPASDYIKVVAPIIENTTLNIISLEGKIIKTMPLISNQTLVSVKDLNSGVYMIEIEKKDSKEVIKLIKY
jgi:hypothetical protein